MGTRTDINNLSKSVRFDRNSNLNTEREVYERVPPEGDEALGENDTDIYELGNEVIGDKIPIYELETPIDTDVFSTNAVDVNTDEMTLNEWKNYMGSGGESTPTLDKILEVLDESVIPTDETVIPRVISRVGIYEGLSPIGKNLMDRIYGDRKGFVLEQTEHPLEQYIISFDRYMDDEEIVRALGSRIGIYIPLDREYTADEIYIDKMIEYIENMEDWAPDEQQYEGFPTTQEIINMDYKQFEGIMKQYEIGEYEGFEREILYQDRLIVLSNIANKYVTL